MALAVTRLSWNDLESDWRRLYQNSQRATPFQSWEWIYNYCRHGMVGGEHMILAFVAEGTCVGIAPFTLHERKRGLKRLMLIGGDYNDILAEPAHEEDVLTALEIWMADNRDLWHVADFRSLRHNALLLRATFKTLACSLGEHQSYPVAFLPGSWEEYASTLGKSFRTQLRYYPNKISRELGHVVVRRASPDSLQSDIDTLFRLHQLRWESKAMSGLFASKAVQEFHRDFANSFVASGDLDLYIYEADGKALASFYGFRKNSEIVYYLGGFDPAVGKYSPLKVLIGEIIKESIVSGMDAFDFIKGEEEYKQDWRAEPRQTYRMVLGSGGVRPRIVMAGLKAEPKVKALRKKLFLKR